MMPCAVCGLEGRPLEAVRADFSDGELRWVPCESPGAACSPECATFIFVRPRDETHDERQLTSWRWRQRRAEARGEAFDEPPPFDEVDRAMLVRASLRGQTRDGGGE